MTDQKSIARFHRDLQRWYQRYGRKELPWRATNDPYAIYISEVMLQQTQVKTVLERFYFPFLKRFPTLKHLARADEKTVLSAWQGLGYYTRAINLHKAAKQCSGVLPQTLPELLALPGIGRNTAHALLALAYRQPVAVMEANLRRVLSRILALSKPTESELWVYADRLLDRRDPFTYNQAMMDIGALVCTPQAPTCAPCPANRLCAGKKSPQHYPVLKERKAVPVRHKKIILICNGKGEYYATPRKTRFLGGLYHFPEIAADAEDFMLGEKRFRLTKATQMGSIIQSYSHFTLQADLWLLQGAALQGKHWHSPQALQRLPFSSAEHKILRLLASVASGNS